MKRRDTVDALSPKASGTASAHRSYSRVEVRAAAEALVDDPVYPAKLARDLRQRKVASPVEQMLWYYSKGKPREIIEHHGALAIGTLPDAELKGRLAEFLPRL
jgi:hypothetical protein